MLSIEAKAGTEMLASRQLLLSQGPACFYVFICDTVLSLLRKHSMSYFALKKIDLLSKTRRITELGVLTKNSY